jgi:hypothetical protein
MGMLRYVCLIVFVGLASFGVGQEEWQTWAGTAVRGFPLTRGGPDTLIPRNIKLLDSRPECTFLLVQEDIDEAGRIEKVLDSKGIKTGVDDLIENTGIIRDADGQHPLPFCAYVSVAPADAIRALRLLKRLRPPLVKSQLCDYDDALKAVKNAHRKSKRRKS